MNAAEHLRVAELLLDEATNAKGPGLGRTASELALRASGHALIALAIEAGAPHAAAPAGVTPDGQ